MPDTAASRAAEALMERAQRLGYPDPDALLHMTPDRARRALRAFEAGQEALAWRIGGYIALALYDPKHYPAAPLTMETPRTMTEAEMKRVLRAIGRSGEDGC